MHELNFIPLSYRKNVPLPKVTYEPNVGQEYAALYYSGDTILVVETEDPKSALVHEFRHHLQWYYGHKLVPVSVSGIFDSYNQFIRNYFRSSWSEMDALLFERKLAPNDNNNFWLNGLVRPTVLSTTLQM